MNASVALPTFAKGRAEMSLVAAGSAAAVLAAVTFSAAENPALRILVGLVGVALIALPFIVLRRLELGLYAFVPLMTALWIEPAPVDFMAVGLLAALVIRGDVQKSLPPRVVLIGLLLLVVSYVLALALAPAERSWSYTALTLLAVAIGIVAFDLAVRDPRVAERAVVVAGFVVAAEAIVALSPLAAGMREGLRIRGFFNDPNEFGVFAVPAVALLCTRWPSLSRAARYAAIGILFLPIVASLARGGALALGVALMVLAAVAAYRHLRRVLGRSVGTLLVGAVALILLVTFAGAALPERNLIQPYDSERIAGQMAGVQQVLAYPFSLGIGPGNYEAVLGHPSHETYLRMLVETGPLSLLALALLLWSVIRLIRLPDLRAVAWVSAIAGFAACGLFVDILQWRELWLIMAVLLAAAAHRDRVRARLAA